MPLISESVTWPAQYYIEVHAVDANVGVVLNTQINVFLDAEAKIARRTEVAFSQLIFSHLQDSNTSISVVLTLPQVTNYDCYDNEYMPKPHCTLKPNTNIDH